MIQNHPRQSQQRDNSFDQRGWRALESRIPLFQNRDNYVDKLDGVKYTLDWFQHQKCLFIIAKKYYYSTQSYQGA